MRKGKGNPTYRPEFADIAKRLCLAFRATDAQLAEAFGVHRAAIEQWKLRYPLFAQAIKEGKAPADANVAASLYMRAVGFEREAVKIFCNGDGKVTREKYMEYFPPEVTACRLWLMNRVPELWRDRRELEVKDTRDKALDQLSDDELLERVLMKREQELRRKAN